MGDCLKLAARKCPQGFDIVMQREEVVGKDTEGGVRGSSRSESQSHRNGNDGYESNYSISLQYLITVSQHLLLMRAVKEVSHCLSVGILYTLVIR